MVVANVAKPCRFDSIRYPFDMLCSTLRATKRIPTVAHSLWAMNQALVALLRGLKTPPFPLKTAFS